MDALTKLKSVVAGAISENELLAPYTSFKIGGPASYFTVIDSAKYLLKLISQADKLKLPYLILGSGTNILFSDNGFAGLVIKMNNSKIKVKDEVMECEAGVLLSKAVGSALASDLSGLEWGMGIPGTIGGAICNNAGAYGGEMSQITGAIEIIRNHKIRKITGKKCAFAYRSSIFKTETNKDVIWSAIFNLKRGDKAAVKAKMDEIILKRQQKEDSYPSAGSVFKNLKLSEAAMKEFVAKHPNFPQEFIKHLTIPTAWLIENCGLKGKTIGGAMVSEKHAGRIVNIGQATAENVIMLISVIKQKVRSEFNLQLMEEIEYRGF